MDDSRKHTRLIHFGGHAVKFELDSPQILKAVDIHFAHCLGGSEPIVAEYKVQAEENARFSISREGREFVSSATADQVLFHLMQDGLTQLNGAAETDLAFHAAAGERWQNGLIFPNSLRTFQDQAKVSRELKKVLKRAGLPSIRFHDLRHTSIIFLLEKGMPINTVQSRSGHSKPSVTTDVYGHSMAGSRADAARIIGDLVTPIPIELQ